MTSLAAPPPKLGELGPVIEPLIRRHAGDAAFYWAQRDGSTHSALIDLAQLKDFDRLLGAHLEGLAVAGDVGWHSAEQALLRHAGPGEAFACTWLALTGSNGQRMAAISPVVARDPGRMLRGLVSALAWVDPALAWPWVDQGLDARAEPLQRIAALRAAALLAGQSVTADFPGFSAAALAATASPHPGIRAAACRLAARLAQPEFVEPLGEDPDASVRADAAIALMWHRPAFAASVLWRASFELVQRLPTLTGRPLGQAQGTLKRWVCHLGTVVPPGHAGVATLLEHLPPRLAMSFLLAHGDSAWLPWIVDRMGDPACARLAGWVWQEITGLDLLHNDLAEPPRPLAQGELPRATDDLDAGLPQPDVERVRAVATGVQHGVRVIRGQEWGEGIALELAHRGPQALRWLAARWFELERGARLDTRAPALWQQAQLAALAALATGAATAGGT